MPFIKAKTSIEVTPQKEEAIKSKLGKAIKLIGKSEAWLMIEFEDNCRLWFRGSKSEPTAIVEIALFGKASDDQYDDMTKAVCEIISDELGISGEEIYVKYEEVAHWGYNSFNF